jgi:hypothetical protein
MQKYRPMWGHTVKKDLQCRIRIARWNAQKILKNQEYERDDAKDIISCLHHIEDLQKS